MGNSEYGRKHVIISLILNLIVFILSVMASIMMFTGFKFMHGYEPVLETRSIGMLRFFTVDSNIFAGIASLILAIYEIKLLKGKLDEIDTKIYVLKLMSATSVGLTFIVVFAYLGPISKGGIPSMLMNSNLFFHLIIPILSMASFVIFERTNKITFKNSLYGMLPTFLYEIYYLGNVFIHSENGVVSPIYDWYWFVQNGVWTSVIVAPMMLLITYAITFILWRLNKKK